MSSLSDIPSCAFIDEGSDLLTTAAAAITEIDKFGGVCVLPLFDPALTAMLLTLRQNIYTDPQKPIQVEPKVYPIGEPGPGSPIFVTTNFSLTYFIVSGEIENSGASGWLVVPECEGMSVLTAWAAGKFSGASIAKFVKETGLEEPGDHARDRHSRAMSPRSAANWRRTCRAGRCWWVPGRRGYRKLREERAIKIMPSVRFEPSGLTIEVQPGTELLDAARSAAWS